MKHCYHGENGITFNLFSEPDDQTKFIRFLKNMRWTNKPKQEYIKRINKGILDAELSSEYIEHYVRKFIPA